MDIALRDRFLELWGKYFPAAELPLGFFYADEKPASLKTEAAPEGHRCLIGQLAHARKGEVLYLDVNSIGCAGGRRYLGFESRVMPNFEYFLSYGIPGKLEGERYKKSPELVLEAMKNMPPFKAPGRYAAFVRWDRLEEKDAPEVVIFFAEPDVVSGLFTLSNFDETDPNGVIAPFGAGCGTICLYPYLERERERPRSVLGMFDVSARPFVQGRAISFATPMKKFSRMIDNMEESFLVTGSWGKVRGRIERGNL